MNNLELFIHVALAVLVCIIAARLVGDFMNWLKQPRVVGEMIAGVLLGPTLFGALFPHLSSIIFQPQIKSVLFVMGNFGLSFYMFLVGAQLETKLFTRDLIRQSGLLSFFGTTIPFGLGILAVYMYENQLKVPGTSFFAISFFMGTALAITAFPMLARILHERNIADTKIGVLSLLSASIQDVVSWILLAFVTAIVSGDSIGGGFVTFIGSFLFISFAFLIIKPLFNRIGMKAEQTGALEQAEFSYVIIALIGCALITDKLGLYSVFGGFILGLVMPRMPVFQKGIKSELSQVMAVFMLPLFFTFSGLNTNFITLISPELLIPAIVIILFAFIGKYVVVTLVMRLAGFNWKESSAIGGLINSRGLMELIIANIGLQYKIIPISTFSILVLIAVLTTLVAQPIYNLTMGKKRIPAHGEIY